MYINYFRTPQIRSQEVFKKKLKVINAASKDVAGALTKSFRN